jgi:hypothetical protein
MNVRSPANFIQNGESNLKNQNVDNQLNTFDENDTEKAMDNEYP